MASDAHYNAHKLPGVVIKDAIENMAYGSTEASW